MLIISNIPQEIYAVACDYEGIDRAEDGDHETAYNLAIDRRAFTDGGLEKAIGEYLLHTGPFADDAEFEEAADSGWTMNVGENAKIKKMEKANKQMHDALWNIRHASRPSFNLEAGEETPAAFTMPEKLAYDADVAIAAADRV